jgi:hypothetical protein
MRYAQKTTVSVERSREEIIRILNRYGATSFAFGEELGRAVILFRIRERPIRFTLPLPDRADSRFTKTPGGRRVRTGDAALQAWEQACRQSWRGLALYILAALEAVESGVVEFDHAFLPFMLLGNRQTVGEHFQPAIEKAIRDGAMPRLMLPWPAKEVTQ